jgi:hypothetical protein
MDTQKQSLQDLQQIKMMMERNSKFISLSGLSGISAGVCALGGAWLASQKLASFNHQNYETVNGDTSTNLFLGGVPALISQLFIIAACVFVAAFLTAFLFTYLRSKKDGVPIWGNIK